MLPVRLQDLHELEDRRKSLKQLKIHCDKQSGDISKEQCGLHGIKQRCEAYLSPASFLLFRVFFVKLLSFAHCADTKKKIPTIFHYLGMLLRDIELLRTPSNSISRNPGSKRLPHFLSCK